MITPEQIAAIAPEKIERLAKLFIANQACISRVIDCDKCPIHGTDCDYEKASDELALDSEIQMLAGVSEATQRTFNGIVIIPMNDGGYKANGHLEKVEFLEAVIKYEEAECGIDRGLGFSFDDIGMISHDYYIIPKAKNEGSPYVPCNPDDPGAVAMTSLKV